jgi:hypothetical protein
MKGIAKELDLLARKLAKKLSQEETPLTQKIDGFKALTTYHLGVVKASKKPASDSDVADDEDEESSSTTIAGIREKIRAVNDAA